MVITAYRALSHKPLPNSAIAALTICLIDGLTSTITNMHKQMAKYFEIKFNSGIFERVCLILDIEGNGKALQDPSKEVYNKLQSYLGQVNISEFCTEDQLHYGLETLFL